MADQFDLAVAADIAGQRTAWRTVLSPETGQFTDRSLTAHTALNGLVTSSRRFLTTKSVYINSVNMVRLFNVVSDAILYIYPYGTKSAGREKSALNGNNQASLGDSPCPNHPSYRLGSYTHLEIYSMPTCTRISRFLGRQETCAGKGEIPGKSRKSIFSKNGRKPA